MKVRAERGYELYDPVRKPITVTRQLLLTESGARGGEGVSQGTQVAGSPEPLSDSIRGKVTEETQTRLVFPQQPETWPRERRPVAEDTWAPGDSERAAWRAGLGERHEPRGLAASSAGKAPSQGRGCSVRPLPPSYFQPEGGHVAQC